MSVYQEAEPMLLADPWQTWEHLAPLAPGDERRVLLSLRVEVHPSFTQQVRHLLGRTRRRGYTTNHLRQHAA